jgi:hypothetical protein
MRDGRQMAQAIEANPVEFNLKPHDSDDLAEIEECAGVILFEDDQGFVTSEVYEDGDELEERWDEIEEELGGDEDYEDDEDDEDTDVPDEEYLGNGRFTLRGEPLDPTAARELELHIVNTARLFDERSQAESIRQSLLRKMKKGTFDEKRSVKAWEYLVEAGAKDYAKEHAEQRDWHRIFSVATRRAVAESLAKEFATEARLGNWELTRNAGPRGFSDIRAGMRVTLMTPQGQEWTGRAVMLGPAGWVLNMGGRHGTPAVVNESNFVRIAGRGSGTGERVGGLRRNPGHDPTWGRQARMRFETKYKIGDVGAEYEFNVKMHHLRGVNISDDQLQYEVEEAVEAFAEQLRHQYKWIGNVYLTGRSAGWLLVKDVKGAAREEDLEDIARQVHVALRRFQDNLREEYGEQD